MRILAISDEPSDRLWGPRCRELLSGVDLILSAGDLKAEYLSFLVTLANRPLLYVHGNHDEYYDSHPPEGCDCIEDKLTVCKGLRILAFGGCMMYNGRGYQYTEKQMARRVRRCRRAVRKAGGVDIILTHAPPLDLGDGDDLCHRGFACLLELIDEYKPRYFIHGHQHLSYGGGYERVRTYGETTLINACGKYELVL
jgi:Icc-related predicted phosphoesterase